MTTVHETATELTMQEASRLPRMTRAQIERLAAVYSSSPAVLAILRAAWKTAGAAMVASRSSSRDMKTARRNYAASGDYYGSGLYDEES